MEAGTTGLIRKIHVVVIQISRLPLGANGMAASWYSWDRSRLTGISGSNSGSNRDHFLQSHPSRITHTYGRVVLMDKSVGKRLISAILERLLGLRRCHRRLHIHVVIRGGLPPLGVFHHHLKQPSAQASLGIGMRAWRRARWRKP